MMSSKLSGGFFYLCKALMRFAIALSHLGPSWITKTTTSKTKDAVCILNVATFRLDFSMINVHRNHLLWNGATTAFHC